MSTLYLIHFDPPYKHAKHYIGFTTNGVTDRMKEHREKRGARLTQVAVGAGCQLLLVRTWEGERTQERVFKKQHNSPRLCPLCNPQGWQRRGILKSKGISNESNRLAG